MKIIYSSFTKIILMFILFNLSVAQNKEFSILATKGEILIQKSGKGKWEKVFTGTRINSNDKIKLMPGSYVGLVHIQGKTIELKKEGIYSVSKLSQEVAGRKTTLTSQFTNLIISEVGSSTALMSKESYKKSMSQAGAVERNLDSGYLSSATGSTADNSKIIMKSPVKMHLLNPELTVEWLKVPSESEYEFILTDRFDRHEFSTFTSDSFINLDTKKLNLEKGVYYFWKVRIKGKPSISSDESCFMIFTDRDIIGLNDTLRLLKEEIGDESSATSKLMYAVFFEKYDMIPEAKAAYLDALKLTPGVDVYYNLYKSFLMRHYQPGSW